MRAILCFILFSACLLVDAIEEKYIPFRENDPASYVRGVYILNGSFTAVEEDLSISAPDRLILTRFYSSDDQHKDTNWGGWRIFPQCLLILGERSNGLQFAFTGERSGAILTYSGESGKSLRINLQKDGLGIVNTSQGEINGRFNRLNHFVECSNSTCEVVLGDGTRRVYRPVTDLPNRYFGAKIPSILTAGVQNAKYFELVSERLPSGNVLLFTYQNGCLSLVEMKDSTQKKLHASIRFEYEYQDDRCVITAITSDERILKYHFQKTEDSFVLKRVDGSHFIPISYEYETSDGHFLLKRKNLPEGRFMGIEYDDQHRVELLKEPSTSLYETEIVQRFAYQKNFTDVFSANGLKTRYLYNRASQFLETIEQYDKSDEVYRMDYKHWGESTADFGMLKSLAVADGDGFIYSQQVFEYDLGGNIQKEAIYGNLTGECERKLRLNKSGQILNPKEIECHQKFYKYSEDGFNLLVSAEDSKGSSVEYKYKPQTNLLIKKWIRSKGNRILKREYYSYDKDGVCVQKIEDDGSDEDPADLTDVTERHMIKIQPKETIPCLGSPEIVEEKALDLKTNKNVFVSKQIHTYFPQGYLRSTDFYLDKNHLAYSIHKTYTVFGQLESETDPEGRKTDYQYDGVGNQILITIPYKKKTIEQKFDLRNRCRKRTELTNGLQATKEYKYDCLGRVVLITDRFGQATEFDYDEFGRLKRLIHPPVYNRNHEAMRPTFSYSYDIFDRVISMTDPKGYTTTKRYNIRGSPTRILHPDGTSELYKYDLEGSLHRSLTRDQKVTVHEYDNLGRISYQETSAVSETGTLTFLRGRFSKLNGFRVTQETEIEGLHGFNRITLFDHDPSGKLIATSQYDDKSTEGNLSSRKVDFIYEPSKQIVKKKIWFGSASSEYLLECCKYDLLGQIKEKWTENSEGNIQLQRYFEYDSFGNCIEEYTNEKGRKHTFFKALYDPHGELIWSSDAIGNETTIQIECKNQFLQKKSIDPTGNQTEVIFDSLRRPISMIKKDAQGSLLSSQALQYDLAGNKEFETNAIVYQGRITGVQTNHWVYGPMNRLESQIEAEGTPEEKRTEFKYDSFGRLAYKMVPGASVPVTYGYDRRGFIEKIEYQPKEKSELIQNLYQCDDLGNIISVKSLDQTFVQRSYDVFGQIIKESIEYEGPSNWFHSSMSYSYDWLGRVNQITLPDQSKISYEYDGIFGRAVKRFSSDGNLLYQHSYDTYDFLGRLLEETGLNGRKTFKYDLSGRPIWQQTEHFTELVPEAGYDPLGNLLQIERQAAFHSQNSSYTYDSLSQLASEDHKTYSYNSLGNHLGGPCEEFSYNSLNQLIGSQKRDYSYDPQGNLRRKTVNRSTTFFKFDILSQLIAVDKEDGTRLSSVYDGFGRRIAKELFFVKSSQKIPVFSSQTFYFGHHELGSIDQREKVQELRVPGISANGISQRSIAIEIRGKPYAPLHDFSGNVAALVDPENGSFVESYTYSAFAEEKIYDSEGNQIGCSAIGNPWRYKEKRIDEETGFIHFGFRYYDPNDHRWISPDPLGTLDGPNLYAFLHNNPLTSFDALGLAEEKSASDPLHQYFYGEVENHCFCEQHRDCKRGGDIGNLAFSNIQKISYDLSFEKVWMAYNFQQSESQVFDLQKGENPDLRIGFINGIWNSLKDAEESAEYISQLANGYNVHYVYNATHGALADLVECFMGLNYIATEPVRQLHKMWDEFFDNSTIDSRFLMVGSSQGIIHLRNALLDYSEDRRRRISVVAIAPAAYVYEETCDEIRHYRAESRWRDFIPRIDFVGAKRASQSVIDLQSHSDAPYFDHYFNSPTYKQTIKLEIINFLKYGKI